MARRQTKAGAAAPARAASRAKAAPPKREKVSPPPAPAEEEIEVVEAPGLNEYLGLVRLLKTIETLAETRYGDLKPMLAEFFMEETAKLDARAKELRLNTPVTVDDLPKSFTVVEGRSAVAKVSLRRKPIRESGLPAATVAKFREANIPLRHEKAGFAVNPAYDGNREVYMSLVKLIAANPDSGVPLDFVAQTPARSMPEEDTLLRILRLGNRGYDLLTTLYNVVISDGEIDDASVQRAVRSVEKSLGGAAESATKAKGRKAA